MRRNPPGSVVLSVWQQLAFLLLALALVPSEPLRAQEQPSPPPASAAPSAEALKYHEMLRRRPQPGVVFDRFTSAWLASGDRASLKEFLKTKSAAAEATAADHLILALVYSAMGEDAEALKACAKAATKAPDDALLQLRTAEIANRLREWDTALNALTRAAQIGLTDESDIRGTRLHADILWRLGRAGEAKQVFRNLIERHPDELSLREELVDMLVENGLKPEAAEESRTLVDLSKDPFDKAMRRLRLADLLVDLRRAPLARTELDLSLAQSGMDSWLEGETLDRMERLYRRGGDVSGFATKLAELATQHPTRVGIGRRQMRILTELARPVDASSIAVDLLKRTPGRRDIREDYITLLEAQEKLPEAIQQMEELLRQQPKDGEIMLRLAGLHGRNNAPERTRELIDLFLKQSPDDEGALIQAGRLLERLSLDTAARDLYEKWMLSHPLDPLAGLSLAALLHRQGDTGSAIQLWRTQGAQGDITTASQVAAAAANRGEVQVAFEILKSREKELLDDPRLIMQICSLAMQARQEADSILWLRRYSQLVKESGELQRLAVLTSSVLSRKATRQHLLDSFTQQPPSGTGEMLLQALAYEFATSENTYGEQHAGRVKADDLLSRAWTALPHPADAPLSEEEALVESAQLQVLNRRRDWPGVLRVLDETVARPSAKTSARLQALTAANAAALNYEAGLKWVTEWKTVAPTSHLPWRTQARLLRSMGKTEEMLVVLREAAARFHEQDEMSMELASALSEAGQATEALAVYRKLFEEKDDVHQRLRIGAQMVRIAKSSDQLEDLVTEWKRYQREHADSSEAWRLLAMAHREKPDVEAHCSALAEALRLAPNDIALMRELALSEDARGNIDKAAELYRQAARKETTPQSKRAYAEFLLKRGESQEALQIMQEMVAAQSTTVTEIEELADDLMAMRLWTEAAALLDEPAKNHAQHVRLQYQRGVALEECGRLEEAAQHFIRVLRTQEELIDATSLPALAQTMAMPEAPGALWWHRLREHGRVAYIYRGAQETHVVMPAAVRAGPVRKIFLPQCLEEAQVFALRHLVRLAEIGRIQSPPRPPIQIPEDVPMAKVWTNLTLRPVWSNTQIIITVAQLREHPLLQAEWVRGTLRVLDLPEGEVPALLLQVEKTFAQTHPDLAAEAALCQAFADASDAKGAPLDRALEYAKRATAGKERLAQLAASWILDEPGFSTGGIRERVALSKQGEERLLTTLTAWAREAATSAENPGLFLSLAARPLSARGHWTEWKDLLDEVVPRIRGNQAALAGSAKVRVLGNFYNILPFPSPIYSGYNLSPRQCLFMEPGWRGRAATEPAPASLAAEAKDPLTKLLSLHAAGLTRELKQEALRLAEAQPDRDDVLFLKASVLAMEGESDALTQAMRQWATLPVSAEVQRSRARYLVEFAQDGSLQPDDATQAAVLEAAKHLASFGTIESYHSENPAEALKTAGFVAPGQVLAGVITQNNRSANATPFQLMGTLTVRTAQDLMRRVDSTSDGGLALRLLSESLSIYASDEIAMARGYAHQTNDNGWQWLTQVLYKKGTFRDSVLLHLLKEAGTPQLSHAEAAFIIDRLGYSSTESKNLYLKALEENPGNVHVRLRVLCLLLDYDSEEIWRVYAGAPVEDRLFMGHHLCTNSNREFVMLTQLMAKFATGVLQDAARRKDPALDLDWMHGLTGSLPWSSGSRAFSGVSALLKAEPPSADEGFGSTPQDPNLTSDGGYLLYREMETLCEAGMSVPDLAVNAFSSYAGLRLKLGDSVESLVPKAQDALRTSALSEGWITRVAFNPFSGLEPAYVWRPSPLALLALHASKQQNTKAAFKELASLARDCKVRHGERMVEALERLYTCKETDFAAAAHALESLSDAAVHWLDQVPAATIARVWKERGLQMDPSPLLLPESASDMANQIYSGGPGIVLQTLVRRGEHEKARAFLVKLMERGLGPRAGWKEYVKGIGADYRDERYEALTFILVVIENTCATEPEFTFLSLELADEAGLRQHPSFSPERFVPSWMGRGNNYITRVPRSVAALNFLAASPWLKPGATLWDCPMRFKEEGTLLTMTAAAIKSISKEDQEGIRATLEQAATKNPGAAILHALVQSDQQKLVEAMVFANATIKDAPDRSIEALGVVMATELAPIQQATAKARAPEMYALMQKLEDSEAARNAQNFYAARTIESLHLTDRQFEETLRRAATHLAATDHAAAVKLLDRGCALIVEKQKRVGWTGSSGSNGWTPCGEVLKQWCDKTPSLDVVTVACDLFHQPDEFNAVSAGWWHCPSWGNALATAWKNEGGLGDPAAGLRGLLHTLHSKLTIKHAPLLIPAFMDFYLKLDPWQRLEVLQAADALAMKNSEISQYAAWVGLAFRLNELADGALWLPGSQDPERIKKIMEGFRAVIQDESVNPLVRLAIAHNLIHKAGKHADPETAWAAMDLATLVLEKEWPAHGYLMLSILNTVNRLPADDRYKTAAARWLPAWQKRNRYTGTYSPMALSYDPVDDYQSAVLTFAARGLDDTGLRQAVQSISGVQQRSTANLLTLVRNDRYEVAREFFMQAKDGFLRAAHNHVEAEEKDMPKILAFSEMLPNPDQRIQARVYCNAFYGYGMLPDLWADSRALAWNRRMAVQARAVMEHAFKDEKLRDSLMTDLADAPAAAAVMAQELREKDLRSLVRTSSFGSGDVSIAQSLRYPMELTFLSLTDRLRQTAPADLAAPGSVFPGPLPQPVNGAQLEFQTLLERVDSGRDSRSKAECMRQIEGNLFEATMLAATSMDAPLLAGFIPAWNKILRVYAGDKEQFEEEALGVTTQIVLAGLSGKTSELQGWREEVPHYRRDSLKAQFLFKRHLMPVAQQLCRTHDGKWRKFEERWKLVQGFAADPWVLEYLKSSRDMIVQLVRNRVLTVDEVKEHADELAKMFPKDGRVAAELAAILKVHGSGDDVPRLLMLAMEQAKDSDAWHAEWGLRLVRWKTEHQQREDAVKLWEEIKGRAKQPVLKKGVEVARPAA